MIKKISIITLIVIILTSCGRKGDPIYNEENQNSKIISSQQIIL